MENFNTFFDSFINGDYFIVFLLLIFMILIVLVLALAKTRKQYLEAVESENINEKSNTVLDTTDLMNLKAESSEDIIDENKPLIKQVDIPDIKTYEEKLEEYETIDEENAVISAEELEHKTKERMNALGVNDNQAAIQKYEEEQEKKAIISYEQLLKNASNVSLTYKEEEKEVGSPKINKVEIQEKEVTPPEKYIDEEEFLQILKEFRLSLE